MQRNMEYAGRSQMTIWRMLIAGWIPNSTNEHSEYVILIAFPLQHWSNESPAVFFIRVHVILKLTAN